MKKTLVILSVVLLSACTPSAEDVSRSYAPPPELKDCTFHVLRSDSGGRLTVVRCPNSSTTTTTGGKNSRTVSVVDK